MTCDRVAGSSSVLDYEQLEEPSSSNERVCLPNAAARHFLEAECTRTAWLPPSDRRVPDVVNVVTCYWLCPLQHPLFPAPTEGVQTPFFPRLPQGELRLDPAEQAGPRADDGDAWACARERERCVSAGSARPVRSPSTCPSAEEQQARRSDLFCVGARQRARKLLSSPRTPPHPPSAAAVFVTASSTAGKALNAFMPVSGSSHGLPTYTVEKGDTLFDIALRHRILARTGWLQQMCREHIPSHPDSALQLSWH